MKDDYSIFEGDCYELMTDMPNNSIDLILTDPPYNINERYSTGNIELSWRADINNDIADWDKGEIDIPLLVQEFKRILKPKGNIITFCGFHQFGDWRTNLDNNFDVVNFMVWEKTNPIPKFRQVGLVSTCELMLFGYNKSHTWNFLDQKLMKNIIKSTICMGSERIQGEFHHATQKPLAVIEHLVNIASNKGDLIFDPFMGLATTGVAALNLGRKFWGIEKENKYYRGSAERLKKTDQRNRYARMI